MSSDLDMAQVKLIYPTINRINASSNIIDAKVG
jgi:hypothetical protein